MAKVYTPIENLRPGDHILFIGCWEIVLAVEDGTEGMKALILASEPNVNFYRPCGFLFAKATDERDA